MGGELDRVKSFLTALVIIFIQAPAFSTTELISFSNYFNLVETTTERSFKIYAGATYKTCSGDNISPCSSCAAGHSIRGAEAAGLACNDTEIYPGLQFSVTMRSSVATDYVDACPSLITAFKGSTSITPQSLTQYQPGVASQDITATWSWSQICSALGADGNCETSFLDTLRIGFNASCASTTLVDGAYSFAIAFRYVGNSPTMTYGKPPDPDPSVHQPYEGLYEYLIFPGDSKVFVIDTAINTGRSLAAGNQMATGAPTHATAADPSGIRYSHARLYFGEAGFNSITTASSYADIPINVDGVQDNRIMGLTNGVTYTFLAANKDQAGNVELFSDPDSGTNYFIMDDGVTPIGGTQSAVPEPVVGLLDGQECFIATAAFGNPEDTQVKTLRAFRDQYLLTNPVGVKFVETYYKYSPRVAKWVAQSPWLRKIVRALLWPLVGLSQVALANTEAQLPEGYYDVDLEPQQENEIDFSEPSDLAESLDDLNFDVSAPAEDQPAPSTQAPAPVENSPSTVEPFVVEPTPPVDNELPLQNNEFMSDGGEIDGWEEVPTIEGPPPAVDLPDYPDKPVVDIEILPTPSNVTRDSNWPDPTEFRRSQGQIKEGRTLIEHPLSEKGLSRINRDGSYEYETERFTRSRGNHFSVLTLPNFRVDSTVGTYESLYGGAPSMIYGGFEFLPIKDSHNVGLRANIGFGLAAGTGILASSSLQSEEKFSLFTLPIGVQGAYRFDYSSRQWAVPFVTVGGGYLGLAELRDDSESLKFAGAFFVETGGGLQFSLMRLSPKSMYTLKRDYDVTDMWITFEAKMVQSLKPDISFSGLALALGLALDY